MNTKQTAVTDSGKASRFTIVHYIEEHAVKAFRVWDNYFDVPASPWFAKLERAESAIARAASYVAKYHGKSLVA